LLDGTGTLYGIRESGTLRGINHRRGRL